MLELASLTLLAVIDSMRSAASSTLYTFRKRFSLRDSDQIEDESRKVPEHRAVFVKQQEQVRREKREDVQSEAQTDKIHLVEIFQRNVAKAPPEVPLPHVRPATVLDAVRVEIWRG